MITFEWIIGFDWNMAHLLRAQKERTSSLTRHFWPMVLVLTIINVFVKIKNSIFLPKYTRYGKNIETQNYLFQRDLQIWYWPFFHRSNIFFPLIKIIIKNKKLSFWEKLNAEYEKKCRLPICISQDINIYFDLFFDPTCTFRFNCKKLNLNWKIPICTKSMWNKKNFKKKKIFDSKRSIWLFFIRDIFLFTH